MNAARLAPPARAGLAEAGGDRDGDATHPARDDLELMALADGGLVDMPGEDELGARVDEAGQHRVPMRYRLLAGPPGRPDEVMMEDDHPKRAVRRSREEFARALDLVGADPPGLMAPGPGRVEPHDLHRLRLEDRLGRLPDALELGEWAAQPAQRPRDVVVAGHRQERGPEGAEKARGALLLMPLRAMRKVAAGDDQIRLDLLHECREPDLDLSVPSSPEMEVGDVQNAGGHDRGRL